MQYLLRAEYTDDDTPGTPDPTVKQWHMTHGGALTAMCGRDLDAAAATRTADDWGTEGVTVCHTCGALYLRETPG